MKIWSSSSRLDKNDGQHTTYNIPYQPIQHTTYNIPYQPIQHTTYNIQHTTYNIQHTIPTHTTYNIQHTTITGIMHHTSYNKHHTTYFTAKYGLPSVNYAHRYSSERGDVDIIHYFHLGWWLLISNGLYHHTLLSFVHQSRARKTQKC